MKYQKVKASERLPEEQKAYYTSIGKATYHPLLKEWRQQYFRKYRIIKPDIWLEPIEESVEITKGKWGKSMSGTEVWHINKDDSFEITKEEIEGMATEYAEQNYGDKDAQWDAYVSFIAGAKAIINLIKGEE